MDNLPSTQQDDWDAQGEGQHSPDYQQGSFPDSEDQQFQSNEPDLYLDLLFIHDATASQGPFISGTVRSCLEICDMISNSGKLDSQEGLRLGLIAFRDHPPQDRSFVVKDFGGFTYDSKELKQNLQSLTAAGGGDLPEAVTAALARALTLEWRSCAAKVILLITDAPPHGIGEPRDGFRQGCPDGNDPLKLAREMAKRGITLFVVACEPSLSQTHFFAHDFYNALTQMTQGYILPLTKVDLLATFVIGIALEGVDLDTLVREFMEFVPLRFRQGNSIDEITREVHEILSRRGQKVTKLDTHSQFVYNSSPVAASNVDIFKAAENIASARSILGRVRETRFTPPYIDFFRSPPPLFEVRVTLKNTSEEIISYDYFSSENHDMRIKNSGAIQPSHLFPLKLQVNTPYNFTLTCGRRITTTGKAFSKVEDMDLAIFFK